MSKKFYPFLKEYIFFQNEGDGSLQHAIEGIINMTEGITIRSKKQTIFFFFRPKVFFIKCSCCTGVQELKAFLF